MQGEAIPETDSPCRRQPGDSLSPGGWEDLKVGSLQMTGGHNLSGNVKAHDGKPPSAQSTWPSSWSSARDPGESCVAVGRDQLEED